MHEQMTDEEKKPWDKRQKRIKKEIKVLKKLYKEIKNNSPRVVYRGGIYRVDCENEITLKISHNSKHEEYRFPMSFEVTISRYYNVQVFKRIGSEAIRIIDINTDHSISQREFINKLYTLVTRKFKELKEQIIDDLLEEK